MIDFYCPELKLAIEIDGESHFQNDAPIYDAARQEFLEAIGMTVLRFTNQQVYGDLDAVIETIALKIQELKDRPLPSPPLCKGREHLH